MLCIVGYTTTVVGIALSWEQRSIQRRLSSCLGTQQCCTASHIKESDCSTCGHTQSVLLSAKQLTSNTGLHLQPQVKKRARNTFLEGIVSQSSSDFYHMTVK